MFLSDKTIKKYLDDGSLVIEPEFDRKNIRPLGIRIHLAKDILVPEPTTIESLTEPADLNYREVDLEKEKFHLKPGEFVLGATYEAVKTPPDVVGFLDGRSTIARLGLTVHVTAAITDGTIEGPHVVVLEIKNVGNFTIRLKHKDPIAMMAFMTLTESVEQKAQTQYGGSQRKVTAPNLNFKTGKDS
jgi:dCTP deaminase